MECPNCKNSFNLSLRFCPYCGKKVSDKKPKKSRKRANKKTETKSTTIKRPINRINKKDLRKQSKKKAEIKHKKETESKKPETKVTETKELEESKSSKKTKESNNLAFNYYLETYTPKEKEILMSTPKKDKEKARERHFNYPSISGLNIYHSLFSDIYFLFDYIKSDRRKIYKKQNTKLSEMVAKCVKLDEKLISYKYDDLFVEEFTECLFESVKKIHKDYFQDKDSIALICVPPSKKWAHPQTEKSITLIDKWCENEDKKLDFKIHNYSDLLKRFKNVPSSKEGDRELYKHQDSIEYNEKKDISKLDMGIIILDDITTSGNSMYACRDILINNGHENKDIISLAIAKAVDLNTEIGKSDDGVILKDISRRVERC